MKVDQFYPAQSLAPCSCCASLAGLHGLRGQDDQSLAANSSSLPSHQPDAFTGLRLRPSDERLEKYEATVPEILSRSLMTLTAVSPFEQSLSTSYRNHYSGTPPEQIICGHCLAACSQMSDGPSPVVITNFRLTPDSRLRVCLPGLTRKQVALHSGQGSG